MANTYFQFKQFKIEQSHCAQKVCTEACIFGALLANVIDAHDTVLDIGSGTGLLSLMIAQKTAEHIDGVEIELPCYEQSLLNINDSVFQQKIKIHHGDINTILLEKKYDWIISNPPFYNNTLPSEALAKQKAKHVNTLKPSDWINFLPQFIHTQTKIALLLARNEILDQYVEMLSVIGFQIEKTISIQDKKNADIKTQILIASQNPSQLIEEKFIIKNDDGSYTDEMKGLMKEYYLR